MYTEKSPRLKSTPIGNAMLGLINAYKSSLRSVPSKGYMAAKYPLGSCLSRPKANLLWPLSIAGSKTNLTSFSSAQLAAQLCYYPQEERSCTGNTLVCFYNRVQITPSLEQSSVSEYRTGRTCWLEQTSHGNTHFCLIMALNYRY